MYGFAQGPGVCRRKVCRLSNLLKGAPGVGSNPTDIYSIHFLLACVQYAVCDLALFSIRARVYPKAVAVLARWGPVTFLRYELRRVNTICLILNIRLLMMF